MSQRTDDLPPVRRASKILLGGMYSLEIGALISRADPDRINTTHLSRTLDVLSGVSPKPNVVDAEIKKLERMNLLVRLPLPGQEVYYRRADSVYFELCRRLEEEQRRAEPAHHEMLKRLRRTDPQASIQLSLAVDV